MGDKYLIVRASGHYPGQKALLTSPIFSPDSRILSFSYLMRGKATPPLTLLAIVINYAVLICFTINLVEGPEVGTLRLLMANVDSSGAVTESPIPIWSKTGHQADNWLHAEMPVASNTSSVVSSL